MAKLAASSCIQQVEPWKAVSGVRHACLAVASELPHSEERLPVSHKPWLDALGTQQCWHVRRFSVSELLCMVSDVSLSFLREIRCEGRLSTGFEGFQTTFQQDATEPFISCRACWGSQVSSVSTNGIA